MDTIIGSIINILPLSLLLKQHPWLSFFAIVGVLFSLVLWFFRPQFRFRYRYWTLVVLCVALIVYLFTRTDREAPNITSVYPEPMEQLGYRESQKIQVITNESSKCKYGPEESGYENMPATFETSADGKEHWAEIKNLRYGNQTNPNDFYVCCSDKEGNKNHCEKSITFFITPKDTSPPSISLSSTIELAPGTTSTKREFSTDEQATCKYSLIKGTPYEDMTEDCENSEDGKAHAIMITGLKPGDSKTLFVRCADMQKNTNSEDAATSISVPSDPSCGEAHETGDMSKEFKEKLTESQIIIGHGYEFDHDSDNGRGCVCFMVKGPGDKQFNVGVGSWKLCDSVKTDEQRNFLKTQEVDLMKRGLVDCKSKDDIQCKEK